MTVCVAIKVHDRIVFAADSATSLLVSAPNAPASVANIWNHGIKVFNLHKQLPIVAMTAGIGHLGSSDLRQLAMWRRI